MKKAIYWQVLSWMCLAGWVLSIKASEPLRLSVHPKQAQIELSWPGSIRDDTGNSQRPVFELQQSADLEHWEPLGKAFRATVAGEMLNHTLPASPTPVYYRLAATLHKSGLSSGEQDPFGYAAWVQEAWNQIGEISAPDFQANYGWPSIHYLPAMDWDPTTCANWEDFKPVAGEETAYGPAGDPRTAPPPRLIHFRLNNAEAAVFRTNGFVVSERLGSYSFPDAFNQIYINDRPVFVATDAILQAWHHTYQNILEEVEEVYLAPSLETILEGMASEVTATWQQYSHTDLKNSLLDADYFVAVARSLLAGHQVDSQLRPELRVANTLSAITTAKSQKIPLFGEIRAVDFSQFTIRGHYNHSERLKRYFRAMMWCGRIDLRLSSVGGEPSPAESLRELGTAAVLTHWVSQSGQYSLWQQCVQTIETFAGYSDSMNFAQLGSLLNSAQLPTLADISTTAALTQLQTALMAGDLGVQNIVSDYYRFPLGPSRAQLPRSFAMFGQVFSLDSWAFSQCVYPNVMATANGVPYKVMRRIPSCLDTAFAVFNNRDCVPDLTARMRNNDGRIYRDGLPYQRQLAAVKATIDAQSADSWDNNLYLGWLSALRTLSGPMTGSEYPSCLRTRAWALKNLNTQMASWTHLRADTALYIKESYTGDYLCSYPYGYVEPQPAFFRQMQRLALLSSNQIASLPIAGSYLLPIDTWPYEKAIDLAGLKSNQLYCLHAFATNMAILTGIATKELANAPLSTNESAFLQGLLNPGIACVGSLRGYDGWYPHLFYNNILSTNVEWTGHGCDTWDPLATSVHTDPPSQNVPDPGCVLHEGVGNVGMLLAAIEYGTNRLIYAGPVLSHYEFEQSVDKRLTTDEWKALIKQDKTPETPAWVEDYFVPGEYTVPEFP